MPHVVNFSSGTAQSRYPSREGDLREQALRFISEFPDVYGQAWSTARQLLLELTGKTFNPDKVWWHRFSLAASSPHTFTGWRHVGTPVESMTLVQLLMHRFTAQDQIAWDELQLYGGFYTDGPDHGAFDERNEVALLPHQVLERFWALDFASVYRQRVERFWVDHSQTFCAMARPRFLAAAGLAPHPHPYNARPPLRLGRSLGALGVGVRLPQADLAARARVSRQWLITAERGENDRLEVGRLMQVLDALDATLTIEDEGRVEP